MEKFLDVFRWIMIGVRIGWLAGGIFALLGVQWEAEKVCRSVHQTMNDYEQCVANPPWRTTK